MKKNVLYIVLAAVGWGTTGIFVSFFEGLGLTTTFVSAARPLIAAVFIGVGLLISNRAALRIKLRDIWVFIGTGIFSFSFFTYCYYLSITKNGMAVAAVLLYTAPVFVTILSALLFKTAFTKYKFIALVLSFAGCALVSEIFNAQYRISTIGIIAGLGSGIGYALYTIFGEFAIRKGYKSGTISFYTFAFASLVTVPAAIFSGLPQGVDFGELSVWLGLFALITAVVPYLLYTKGLEGIEPSMAAVSATFEPLVAAILGVLVLKETPTISKIVGIVLILSSLIVAGRQKES